MAFYIGSSEDGGGVVTFKWKFRARGEAEVVVELAMDKQVAF